ncbi:hypothetical protein [Nocardia panacis]|uniref:hypothetical protein n=1 Tax=Nocardia panacis TaxID=2340916 RepID=UPI0011C46A23|nr:hypothetical protein [Nocardia panacis]
MPEYDKDRAKVVDNNKRGRVFENGACDYYRDHENGYVQQSRIFEVSNVGNIRFDKIKEDGGKIFTIEEKSGRIDGKKDVKQLRVVYALLERGEIDHHTLRSVEREPISGPCQELMAELIRDFPDKFTHQVISRNEAREIWARGLQQERGQQLELPGVGEKAREQRAKQREQARELKKALTAAEQSRQQDVANARERAALFRKMERFREGNERGRAEARETIERIREAKEFEQATQRELTALSREQLYKHVRTQAQQLKQDQKAGRTLDADRLYEVHKDLTQDLDMVREQEREDTRNILATLNLGKEQTREMELEFELSREEQRQDVVKDLNSIALAVQREDQRRETAQKEQQQREARETYGQTLRERGICPEIAALIQLQQAPGLTGELDREREDEAPRVQGRSRRIDGRGGERTRW